MRKNGKSEISKIQKKLWELCRQLVFREYGDFCYTCGRFITGSNRQCGHMWAKASCSAIFKYDIRILRPQCYHCNINLGGNGAVFYANMLKEKGSAYMKKLDKERLESKQTLVKALDHYKELIVKYENKLRLF